MGISSMPEPRDSLLWYLVVNTVISITALAGLVRKALVFLDLQDDDAGDRLVASAPGLGLADRFLRAFRPALYGVLVSTSTTCSAAEADGDDCSVCLSGFVAKAVVNRLPCGHLFHRACLETWLRYERATCPLCRANVPLPPEETPVLRYPELE
ncbi:hypothetical protein BDA96_02G250200 [Sorghum bicolor]|jgi:RING/U-box domain-containing protein|uniref:RING-type domain-containing protein n=2 Tax=Sorghum bicolor TaxID=4558 RepID=A0A1W0W5P1_SORBI|nr:probable E3 ubiquitin-protein ligase XERICO [Sorghum bicolor]KAG0544149.1 hypothetical protein BDA96_02G250200 [Sorghum bicolor]OQU89666.1 hypothetical protein SORBI_3002G239200 [Sorghum bicolor]|eukprot:XP_002462542.1 probable E3 ubiquitin-protein ligase XERICO [Sorghum bicolor]